MPARTFYIVVHFFAVHCKTTTSNDRIKGFAENMNTQRLILFSLFELESRHRYKLSSWKRNEKRMVLFLSFIDMNSIRLNVVKEKRTV